MRAAAAADDSFGGSTPRDTDPGTGDAGGAQRPPAVDGDCTSKVSFPGRFVHSPHLSRECPPVLASHLPPALLVLQVLLTNKQVGSIIGRKGSVINLLRDSSGARINVSDAIPGFQVCSSHPLPPFTSPLARTASFR